jgi:hypothetical protein
VLFLLVVVDLIELVDLQYDGQMRADEGHAGQISFLKMLKVAVVVVVAQLYEYLVDPLVLEVDFCTSALQAAHGRRLKCRVDLFESAVVVHFVEVGGNVLHDRTTILKVEGVDNALGVPVSELVREVYEFAHVWREFILQLVRLCPSLIDKTDFEMNVVLIFRVTTYPS